MKEKFVIYKRTRRRHVREDFHRRRGSTRGMGIEKGGLGSGQIESEMVIGRRRRQAMMCELRERMFEVCDLKGQAMM